MEQAELMDVFLQLGIALGLGLLVGMQRERHASRVAGFRTFPLVTLLGSLGGLLSAELGGWILAAAFLALAAMIVVGNLAKISAGDPAPGLTTEMAMLVMFAVGALLTLGPIPVAIAIGGVVAVLLQFKEELHGLAGRIGDQDFKAIFQFVLITLVVLPVLPDRAFGPYGVLNPRQIWWLVVLIVGIGLGGYVAYKLLGRRVGGFLGGILGGLISSTATTVSYARRTRQETIDDALAARVILIASAVVYVRLLVEIAVVAPAFLEEAAAPILVLGAVQAVLARIGWQRNQSDEQEMPPQGNPTQLRSALTFTLFFAVVLVAVPWAQEWLGTQGTYVVAALSGLAKMDAITLSTARLVGVGELAADTGWRMIILASLTNLAFKTAAIGIWGSRRLLGKMLLWWGIAGVVGIGMLLWWP